jgi:hypothetical protein
MRLPWGGNDFSLREKKFSAIAEMFSVVTEMFSAIAEKSAASTERGGKKRTGDSLHKQAASRSF